MANFKSLISLPLDIPTPPDISDVLDSETEMSTDTYRVSPSILLMTPDGEWLPISKKMPDFVEWAESHLFPWTQRSQMVVITTPTGKAMAPHIDCSPERFNTLQHKFRYVFRGNVTDLRWITADGYIKNPHTDKPYIISGKWPHDMINTHDKTKYTLCLGAPWEPNLDDEKYADTLQRSFEKYGEKLMTHDNWALPANWRELFNQEKYGIPIDLQPTFL
jgi:hypothetical protein